jgi:hypothetical protein
MRAALEQRDGFVVVSDDGSATHRCLFCGTSVAEIDSPRPISVQTVHHIATKIVGGTFGRNALVAKESSAVCKVCLALTRSTLG